MNLGNASDIIGVVTTPVTLAALFLLILSGIILSVVSPKNKDNRQKKLLSQVVRYSFVTAIVLSLSANLIQLLTVTLNEDSRIVGLVQNSNGKTISRAIIDIVGVGRSVTDDNGAFTFSIPSGRTNDQYLISVTVTGYQNYEKVIQGPNPSPQLIKLEAPKISSEHLIKVPGEIMVGHYLGVPQIEIPLLFKNPTPSDILVEDTSVNIISPLGINTKLFNLGIYFYLGEMMKPPLPQVNIQPQGRWRAFYSYLGFSTEAQALSNRVALEMQGAPGFFTKGPQYGVKVITDDLSQSLRDHLESNFHWVTGEWKIIISCSVGGKEFSKSYKYQITDGMVDTMKGISEYYSVGAGAFFGNHLNPFGNAKPVTTIKLKGDM